MSDKPSTSTRGRGRGILATTLLSKVSPAMSGLSLGQSTSTERERDGATASGSRVGRGGIRDQRNIGVYTTKSVEGSKKGSSGRELTLSANYFRLKRTPQFEFNMYRVDFRPDVELEVLRKVFVAKQSELLGGYLFDGVSMVYLTKRLEEDEYTFDCETKEGKAHKMILKNTNSKIQMTDSMGMQILNLILRRTMEGLGLQMVGRNLYDPKAKIALDEFKLELWPGYITSIRQHEDEVLICCEISHKVMRKETIYDIMRAFRNDNRDWKENFQKEIIGSTVLTKYSNQTFRIDEVSFEHSPLSKFKTKAGTEISFVEYYDQHYDQQIQDKNQPMLVSKPKKRDERAGANLIMLVPELCYATGLTAKMRSNFRMMKAMAEHTQMAPDRRTDALKRFTDRLHKIPKCVEQLTKFNTGIEDEFVKFSGRGLPQETIFFGEDKTAQNDDKVDWTHGMKMNPMFQDVALKRWIFMFPVRARTDSEAFIKLMMDVARGFKYEMEQPQIVEIPDDRIGSYTRAIDEHAQKDPRLMMIVLPNNAADRYSAIKRSTYVSRFIPTQLIVQKTMQPKKGGHISSVKSIATKVVVQLNCKLGGAPWMIKFPLKGVMTIGFDVTHNTHDRRQSFGAFIASMDLRERVQYYSSVTAHKDGSEMSANMKVCFIKAIKSYKALHNTLPERIFFYRDGVSDGQIEQVHSQEVKTLSETLEEIYQQEEGESGPKFSFIVVNKRINTKIFLKSGSYQNPPSGTVVDHTITLPERYDFYLISQSVRQGTVAPTSYNIIHDTNGLTPDKMQVLTYKMCHLYYNWSGTTRVPAVVQYAHKLAFLVGEHLHQTPNEELSHFLYFL